MNRTSTIILSLAAAGLVYLALWPVPITPVGWEAPLDKGYTGAFERNDRLKALEFVSLQGESGPEDAAVGPDGAIYVPTHSGKILRVDIATGRSHVFATPGGRVLGIEFSDKGELYAADAYRGLLRIAADGTVTVLADKTVDGSPIVYANDLDIAADGVIYFSDASTKFGAKANGGTLPAALLDLMEHGLNGRVLKYDRETQETTVVIAGQSYANGVALAADGSYLLIAETGTYAILKHWLTGSRAGETETLIANLPGFPDNINDNPDGTFWTGLVSPRSPVVDRLAGSPFFRAVIMRLPAAVRPGPQRYGFAIRFDGDGNILENLQDPDGGYASVTGAVDAADGTAVFTSLTEPRLGFLRRR